MTSVQTFLQQFNHQVEQQLKEVSEASWMAQTTGDPAWAAKLSELSTELSVLYASPETYAQAQNYLQQADQYSALERRELTLLVNRMKGTQLPKDVIADLSKRSSELNLKFNTYTPEVDGQKYLSNDIRNVLVNSTDNELREKVWYASKEVGQQVAQDLLQLVKKRNESAKLLGYNNYHEMGFALQELDRDEVFALFNELIEQSDTAYRTMKKELDERLAAKFQIDVDAIRPWHYSDPFFQEAPSSPETNLDAFYKDQDLIELTTKTFASMGIEIDDLYAKSDLFPREKKNPTAFCTDIDRAGDVRVLCNLQPDAYWMETNLHEFGHAAYFKYIDRTLPFSLRTPSHTLTTESIAMLFGKLGKDPRWLKQFLQLDEELVTSLTPALTKFQQAQMLIQARWMITFTFFERELYENPEQDLNALWWKLVQQIQHVTPPDNRNAPDWAAKIHFTLAPIYYQNYLLGELMAAQLLRHIEQTISPALFTTEAGQLLIEQFFKTGAMYQWNEKIERVTGEKLNPAYFVALNC